MNRTNKSVVPGHHFGSSVAVATAGILALSLVTVPPSAVASGPDVRAVQLTALPLTPQVPVGAIPEFLISHQAAIGVGGGADITAAGGANPLALEPAAPPASAIAEEPPQLDISWIGQAIFAVASWFPGPTSGIVIVAGFSLAFITVIPFLAFIYDPIVKSINFVLNLFGLPLLPVYIQDPVITAASETLAAPSTPTAVPSDPVAPPAKTGAPAGERVSAKAGAKTAPKLSTDPVAKAGGTVSTDLVAKAGEPASTEPLAKSDEPVSTEPLATADQTLSATSAKLRPAQDRSRPDVSQRPHGVRHPGDPDVAARPAAGRKTATAGAASSPASTSTGNSSGSSSTGNSGS